MSIKNYATTLLLLGAFAGATLAQKPMTPRPFEIKLNVEEPSYMLDQMRMSAWTHKPLALYNLWERAQSADPETAARLFLAANKDLLGFQDPTLGDLQVRTIRSSRAGQTVRFSQWFHGVQVFESETVVNISPDGHITFVLNGNKSIPATLSVSPAINSASARNAIVGRIGLEGAIDFDQTNLVVYHHHGTTRLAWNVRLNGESPIGDWNGLVDAQTGEVFRCEDVSCYHQGHPFLEEDPNAGIPLMIRKPQFAIDAPTDAIDNPPLPLPLPALVAGNGNAFDADPLSSAGATYGGSYVDGNDANAAVLTAQLQNKNVPQITLLSGTYSLVGPYAELQDFEAPNKGLFTQASAAFSFDRNADGFEAFNTYFFIDQSLRYVNTTLGISLMPFQYAGGMRFDPSGLSGADNSHYIGSTGRLAFGEGGVDDAEDSDVILHELGHALHDFATSGSLSQVNGLSEGTGDYWAMSYSRSKNQWTSLQAPYQWVFSWDGHNPFWGGRVTNYAALYPGGLVGQIHTDGQIWSTCLMKIYDAIGRTKTDMALWEGLMLTNSTTSQQDAAIAFRQAGINMGYTMTELTQITNFFTGCGYILPPFPVNYASFTADRQNAQYVNLHWETATESQNTGFEVQRRLDSETEFATVGFVGGSGTTDDRHGYAFQDVNPSTGVSYYRLQQVDLDGNRHLSEVLAVVGSAPAGLSFGISPNPVTDRLEVIVMGLPEGQSQLDFQITDLTGRVLVADKVDTGTRIQIPGIQQLASGVYMLRLTADGQSALQRFVKK